MTKHEASSEKRSPAPVTCTSPTANSTSRSTRSPPPDANHALAAMCELLNDTETIYPGTDLVLSYSVKPHPAAA